MNVNTLEVVFKYKILTLYLNIFVLWHIIMLRSIIIKQTEKKFSISED